MIDKDGPIHQGSKDDNNGIELSPSSSPQNASPVHVQFSPSVDRDYLAMAESKKEKDS